MSRNINMLTRKFYILSLFQKKGEKLCVADENSYHSAALVCINRNIRQIMTLQPY